MIYLFSKSSLQILESLSFTQILYAFDFDGTLAPIVKDPQHAWMRAETMSLLAKLGEHVPTAVISGRSLADMQARVPSSVRYLIGNHGLEGLPDVPDLDELRSQVQSWKRILERELTPVVEDLGITMEDKDYSLAVHYRRSRKKKIARIAIQGAISKLHREARCILGKFVFNLIPPKGPHKGAALQRIMEASGANFSLYVGDDDTDEDVFQLPDREVFSIRVGSSSKSRAKYFIRNQKEVDQLLRRILQFHGIR